MRWWYGGRVLNVAAALLLAAGLPLPACTSAPAPTAQRPCDTNALCLCRADHFACNMVPFHRFPDTEKGVWHVSVSAARLGVLGEAALDERRLRTLVLVASRLHHIEPGALTSMVSTLASLDLGYNEFTEVPIEALRELKVLNWLNLQNNYISELDPGADWGFLTDSLSSLSLSNNNLCVLHEGALSSLRQLAQLDLEGNRLHSVAVGALPPALSLLRLADNLLPYMPCAALAPLPRLRHLHLRNNLLHSAPNRTCRPHRSRIDSLDLSQNDLDDRFELEYQPALQLRQLILDLNDFTTVPVFALDGGRLEKLSMSHNKLSHLSNATLHALRRELERLDLDHNELESLPATVRDLTRLRHLSLSYNKLEDLSHLPPYLQSLSLAGNYFSSFPIGLQDLAEGSLEYLDLGYNQIALISAEWFGAWAAALGTLVLKGNRIAQLAAGAFPAVLPVRELVLSFNDLYHVEPDAFSNLTALQVLELSSTLFSGEFPLGTTLDTLVWLSLDNNNIHHISSTDLLNYPLLEYLNLDFNKIIEFPSEVIKVNVSSRLKELRLSYNYVSKLHADYLTDLPDLQSIDLSYNRMQNISENSFFKLLNLAYLSLAGNVVDFIAEKAFCDLPRLEVLDLQDNNLAEFSTQSFDNISSDEISLSVNVSYNRITSLGGGPIVSINILDLSHNLLESVSKSFFDSLGPHIRQLVLSHNRLTYIDNYGFGVLPKLDILSLHSNNISILKRRAFLDMPSLQILDLSHNKLTQLAVEQFHNMRRLRHLKLDANELRALPRDAFKNTVLEHLDLSDNQLSIFPSSALAQVGFTLRRLELARNRLEYLDSAMFHAIAFLHELSLAHNALTVLSDNTFAGLARLRRLNLSQNAIKTNFKELFHNLPRLRRLALASAGLRTVPHLPLANLTELDLTGNYIASYREADVRKLNNLRALDLTRNKFTSLQPTMWSALPHLIDLDVSHNPIVRISHGSLEGLDHLLHLRIDHLRHLEVVEPRAFRPLVALRSLALESPVGAARGEATLADIASATPGLESLTVRVHEMLLDTQLEGFHATKLRALEIRGTSLRQISPRAFEALGRQRSLVLRVTGTGVSALPAGLVRPLTRVPHLGLDLSDNRLVTLGPAMLYPNLTGWNRLATKLLPGGLVVADNPLQCGCAVSWVGAWLRRWTAEAGAWSRGARDAARRSTCVAGGGGGGGGGVDAGRLALLALEADEAECHASALSSGAPRPLVPRPPHAAAPAAFLWIVLLHSIS